MSKFLPFLIITFIVIIVTNSFVSAENLSSSGILTLLNDSRRQAKATPLVADTTLEESALVKAKKLCANNNLEHGDWKKDFSMKLKDKSIGENLGRNYTTNEALVDSWLKSSTHKANILDKDFKYIGIAIYSCKGNDSIDYNIIVNHFSD